MQESDIEHQLIVGFECHVQLATRSKLFCGCAVEFGAAPNSRTCPVCLGLPGALPVMNRRAFEFALLAGLALDCRIARRTKWDRKSYYYPDLPKNYQISQYDLPLSADGAFDVPIGADGASRRVGIIRAHLE
ncbi:MAG: Asp-tRNA(Asn)/Glu-tRNA(Gln) amidotransferase GatCAB subunit B, partial [Phycisphaerae bacterium]